MALATRAACNKEGDGNISKNDGNKGSGGGDGDNVGNGDGNGNKAGG